MVAVSVRVSVRGEFKIRDRVRFGLSLRVFYS